MDFEPHIRMTWSGTLPSGEIWSNHLALDNQGATEFDAGALVGLAYSPWNDATKKAAFVSAVTTYHASAIATLDDCHLKQVSFAAIDAEGHYVGPATFTSMDVVGSGNPTTPFPHQIARKITLEAFEDLGRVKGGWYQPRPSRNGFDFSSGLWDTTTTGAARDATKTFIDALNAVTAGESQPLVVCIASQGRHNSDGSVRVPKGNYKVTSVNVGRRADVQRRRANKLGENRITDAVIA